MTRRSEVLVGSLRRCQVVPSTERIRARTLLAVGMLTVISSLLVGCEKAKAPAKSNSGSPPASQSAALASRNETCISLIPSVIKVAQETGVPSDARILYIDSNVTVSDRQSEYAAGTLKVPPGERSVAVLTCTGTAVLSTNANAPMQYNLQYDLQGARFVSLQR